MALGAYALSTRGRLMGITGTLAGLVSTRTISLAFVLGIGLTVRLWGVTFGLPFDYQVDEWPYVVPALVLGRGEVDALITPLSVLVYLEHGFLDVIGEAAGFFGPPLGFGQIVGSEQAVYLLLARLTSVALGTATIIPVYLLGRQWWGEMTALLAALFFSLAFLAVRNSHYGVPDSSGAFFVMMSAYLSTRLSRRGRTQPYALAGFMAGLALAARPLAVLVVLPALFFHLRGGAPIRRVSELRAALLARNPAVYLGMLILAFAIGAPVVVLQPITYAKMIHYQMGLGRLGGFGSFQVIDEPGWLFYLTTLRWGIGDPALGLGVLGVIWIVIREWGGPAYLFTFPILTFLYMGNTGHAFARYLMPVLPFLALAAAFITARLLTRLHGPIPLRTGLGIAFVGVMLAQPARAVLKHDQLLMQTDTRTLAEEWIEENLPDGATVGREWFTPVLPGEGSFQTTAGRRFDVRVTSVFGLSGDKEGMRAGARTLGDYTADGVQYVVTSSFVSDVPMIRQEENARKQEFYQTLDAKARLLSEFRPYAGDVKPAFIFDDIYGPAASEFELERPGPVIKIYKLPSTR